MIEQNPITVAAVDGQTFGNHINYYFSRWNDGNTSSTRTFYPSSHGTYTAVFVGKPSISNRNLHTGSVYNQPIVLYWNEHPNTYVTNYQIWRKVKHNGVMGNPVLIATVNRGTTTYTDYDYYLTNGYTSDLIFYDVRPYYSIEGTTSDPSWLAVYGDGSVVPKSIDSTNVKQGNTEYSIANYPNPFNPATKIAYTLKEAGNVNIKVYNLLGQQVAELVNEMQQPGSYTIEFDGSNLPSGTYIYTLITNNYTESKKMILLR
ncbi:MAG: T9SS type A sorting domain-containing protein [Ignavibacterium sp.]